MRAIAVFSTHGLEVRERPLITLDGDHAQSLLWEISFNLTDEGRPVTRSVGTLNGQYVSHGSVTVHARWTERPRARLWQPWVGVTFDGGAVVRAEILDGASEVVGWLNGSRRRDKPLVVGEAFGHLSLHRIGSKRDWLVVRARVV